MDDRMSCCGGVRAATREEVEDMVQKGRELRGCAIGKAFPRMVLCIDGFLRALRVRGREAKEA